MFFVDLSKAFDIVSIYGLSKLKEKLGLPSNTVTVVRLFQNGMMVKVLNGGNESEAFPKTNGVKQRCVLVRALFSHNGIHISYSIGEKLVNHRRMYSVTNAKDTVIRVCLLLLLFCCCCCCCFCCFFVYDCAINTNTQHTMRYEMNSFF